LARPAGAVRHDLMVRGDRDLVLKREHRERRPRRPVVSIATNSPETSASRLWMAATACALGGETAIAPYYGKVEKRPEILYFSAGKLAT
jgi:hypothetical protein